MILKNRDVAQLGRFLFKLTLSGKKSRMRTRFVKLLEEHLAVIRSEMDEVYIRYSEKNEDGTPKIERTDKGDSFVIDDVEKCNSEILEVLNEDFVVDNTIERREMLLAVKEIVLETDLEFSGEEAELYDTFCEIVEGIEY